MLTPVLYTRPLSHREHDMGHAATRAIIAVLILVPLLGLGIGRLIQPASEVQASYMTGYGVAQMVGYSPLVSWLGLLLGVPCVHWSIRNGYGGWLATVSIGAVIGSAVLTACVLFMLDVISGRVAGIGAAFGFCFAAVYWGVMRWSNPALFRATGATHPATTPPGKSARL